MSWELLFTCDTDKIASTLQNNNFGRNKIFIFNEVSSCKSIEASNINLTKIPNPFFSEDCSVIKTPNNYRGIVLSGYFKKGSGCDANIKFSIEETDEHNVFIKKNVFYLIFFIFLNNIFVFIIIFFEK